MSFGMWAEAFESHLRRLPPDEVRSLCGGFVGDLGALLRSAAAIAGGTTGEPPRVRLLESLAVLLGNIAKAGPVIVFLDDAQLADASSWDALHYCARNLGSSPVLVIVAARPAELTGQAGPNEVLFDLEQDGQLTRLELGPLSHDAVTELATAALGITPPPTLMAWLEERARGNPLFVVNLLQALLDENADLAAPRLDRLPEGLTERVVARLGILDEPARRTLDLLAVVGRRVTFAELMGLTDRPEEELGPILDGLARSPLISPRGAGTGSSPMRSPTRFSRRRSIKTWGRPGAGRCTARSAGRCWATTVSARPRPTSPDPPNRETPTPSTPSAAPCARPRTGRPTGRR